MPEFPNNPLYKRLKEIRGQGKSIRDVMNTPGRVKGNEVTALSTQGPHGELRLLAINHHLVNPLVARKQYWVARVMSTLFPHNFPTIVAMGGNHPDIPSSVAGSLRQLIPGERINEDGGEDESRHPFGKVREAVEELSLPVRFDGNPSNFLIHEGSTYYVDTVAEIPFLGSWNMNQVIKYMKMHQYSAREIAHVTTAIERIDMLNNQRAIQALHDTWRQTALGQDETPLTTSDSRWIKRHHTNEVHVRDFDFLSLPKDIQKRYTENLAGIKDLFAPSWNNGKSDITRIDQISERFYSHFLHTKSIPQQQDAAIIDIREATQKAVKLYLFGPPLQYQ